MKFDILKQVKKNKIVSLIVLIIMILISLIWVQWITAYVPAEQYSTEVNRCSPEELDLNMSINDTRFIQPYDLLVISTNKKIFGNQSFKNLTQEQWLRNAEIIFDWFRENITYDSTKQLDPKPPNETIIAHSGDCKNMAFLFISMAINAGVPPENVRLVVARERSKEDEFICRTTHAYVEIKYDYNGKTVWMPIELTNKKFKFFQFLNSELFMPEVRFGWISYGKYGYFDDKGIEKDWIYEIEFRLYRVVNQIFRALSIS